MPENLGGDGPQAPPATPNRPAKPEDKPPKKKGPGRPKGSKNKPRAGQTTSKPSESSGITRLRKDLENLFRSPAFMFEAVGENWPAKHVDEKGKLLAAEITSYADKNPAFRTRLEAFLEGGETSKLIFAGAMYALPLGMYFGLVPAPERVKILLAVPDREPRGGIAIPAIPEQMREQVETEAKERGFVLPDGSADLEAFMQHVKETIERDGRM